MRRSTTALAAVSVALATGAGTAGAEPTRVPAAAPDGTARADAAYLTLSFGRTQFVSTDRMCTILPNAVNLGRIVTLMHERGLTGVGNVVLDRQGVTRSCFQNYMVSASWNDLTQWRQKYGWTFVSAGMSYLNMQTLTPTEQMAEACGSVGALARRGHTRAWGLFAYPNNKYSDKIQSQVVKKCFAFGRRYGTVTTTKAQATAWPNWSSTVSVNGGRCEDTALACNAGTGTTYQTPAKLIPKVKVRPGQWTNIQFYRFVTGTSTTGTSLQWNCTGPESSHWTSDAEVYCSRDFLRVIDAIPDTVTVTDPATVAEAWGVKPSS